MAASIVSLIAICACIIMNVSGQSPPGIIDLDGYSFPKIVDGSHNVIIKFGEKYSYGDDTAEQVLLLLYYYSIFV